MRATSFFKMQTKVALWSFLKGSTIVILDKESYLKPVETLLKCSSKFKKIPVAPDKHLKYY